MGRLNKIARLISVILTLIGFIFILKKPTGWINNFTIAGAISFIFAIVLAILPKK